MMNVRWLPTWILWSYQTSVTVLALSESEGTVIGAICYLPDVVPVQSILSATYLSSGHSSVYLWDRIVSSVAFSVSVCFVVLLFCLDSIFVVLKCGPLVLFHFLCLLLAYVSFCDFLESDISVGGNTAQWIAAVPGSATLQCLQPLFCHTR